jgi:ABC-type bacteriocin/lantibiotic exporter with double-glycine peptidase domain
LDEATSAMDNESQFLLHQNLMKLKITRLVIAHRMTALQNADNIYIFEGKGSVIQKLL